MDEKDKDKDQHPAETSEAESSIAEMYKSMQAKYEAEVTRRQKAEADVVALTKVIRTMDIKPAELAKEESLEDLTKKLFN